MEAKMPEREWLDLAVPFSTLTLLLGRVCAEQRAVRMRDDIVTVFSFETTNVL